MMTPTLIGLLMFGGMLLLMGLCVPIAAAMFIPGALGYMAISGDVAMLNLLKGSAVARLTVYELSVIPLFLLMGQFATQGGLSRDLFRAAAAFVGHIRGGLSMAAIMSAAVFGAVCGSSVATSATITQVAYPEMKANGYHGRLSTATLAAGGTLGILIPPSVPLVASVENSAMVFMIFLGADMMNASLALTEMPARIADWVTHLAISPLLVVSAVLVLYVVLGCVMDELSMLLLTIPVIFPAIMGLDLWGLEKDMKAIWFGILVLMTAGIGLIAPPVGLKVYVVNNLARDVPMSETYKGVFPFLAWDALRVVLLLLFPGISLWLVTVLFK